MNTQKTRFRVPSYSLFGDDLDALVAKVLESVKATLDYDELVSVAGVLEMYVSRKDLPRIPTQLPEGDFCLVVLGRDREPVHFVAMPRGSKITGPGFNVNPLEIRIDGHRYLEASSNSGYEFHTRFPTGSFEYCEGKWQPCSCITWEGDVDLGGE